MTNYPSTVTTYGYPSCCGITIISDFSLDPDTILMTREEDLKRVKEYMHRAYTGIKLIALNHIQVQYYGPRLVDLGFEAVGYAQHIGHGNDIYLFQYLNHKPKHPPIKGVV